MSRVILKGGRLVPEPFVVESEFVAVVVRGDNDVIDNQVRRNAPSRLIEKGLFRHRLLSRWLVWIRGMQLSWTPSTSSTLSRLRLARSPAAGWPWSDGDSRWSTSTSRSTKSNRRDEYRDF